MSQANLRSIFFHSSGLDGVTEAICSAVQDLAKNKFGALIVLEKRVGLRNYEETGEILNAKIVVSEETGGISIAYRNTLRRKLSIKEVEAEIKRHWKDLFDANKISNLEDN